MKQGGQSGWPEVPEAFPVPFGWAACPGVCSDPIRMWPQEQVDIQLSALPAKLVALQ